MEKPFSPLLTVIVPVYNSGCFLPAALSSLADQTLESVECVIVDDGSTDDSPRLIDAFCRDNPGTRVVRQENQGYGAACNIGLSHATGKYVAFFEPDDILKKTFYERLCLAAEKHDAPMVRYNGFYHYRRAPHALRFAHYTAFAGVLRPSSGIKRLWTSHPGICNGVYRRETLLRNNVRFPESPGASFQDAQFLVSLYYIMKSVYIVDDAGYYYREHPQQSVNAADSKVDAVIQNWDWQLGWLRENGHTDLSFFLFNCFAQFHTLYTVRLQSRESKARLFRAMKRLVAKVGIKKMAYPDAHRDLRLLFKVLWGYPVLCPALEFFSRLAGKRHAAIGHAVRGAQWFLHKVLGETPGKTGIRNSLLFETAVRSLPAFPRQDEGRPVDNLWRQLETAGCLGIRVRDHLALSALLPATRLFSPDQSDFSYLLQKADYIALWGQFQDDGALALLEQAMANSTPVAFMDEGLLRSVTPTPDSVYPADFKIPLSFIADCRGAYYDIAKPSMLEDMLNSDRELSAQELSRAQRLIRTIVTERLSKVNHQPDNVQGLASRDRANVLVVDQAYGDWSIRKGAASDSTFLEMLQCALLENPDATVLIKTHPDMLADARRGGAASVTHFSGAADIDRVRLVTAPVNPYALMESCEKVYVCTSQMGFEALLAQKETVIFGAPFYAGWGVGDVRNTSPHLLRRKKQRSIEEIFYFMCIEYTRYVDPRTMRPCELEVFIDALLFMRSEFRQRYLGAINTHHTS